MQDLREAGPGQRQQADRGDGPGVRFLAPIQHAPEALQLATAEEAGDQLARVPDNVGTGVGDVLAEVAPLARGGEQGAQNLIHSVGRSPSVGATANVGRRTLTARPDFTDLPLQLGQMWLDGDLGHTIAVRGVSLQQTGDDNGALSGIFVGRQHEGVADTLERRELTAAFGGAR